MNHDPDSWRFREYAESHTNESPVDLSGREGAPRAWTCDDCGEDVGADEEHACVELEAQHGTITAIAYKDAPKGDKMENDHPYDEVLEIQGDPMNGRIVTQYLDDEIIVNCGIRSADVTRRLVTATNNFQALADALKAVDSFYAYRKQGSVGIMASGPLSGEVLAQVRAVLAAIEGK